MNESQTIFVVFYAIFWGAIANVQPKWKPFQTPLIFSKWPFGGKVLRRVLLSFFFFNLAPLIFFIWTILFLSEQATKPDNWSFNFVILITVKGIIPSFIIFGFYHFWLAIVEFKGEWFYAKDQNELPDSCKRLCKESQIIDPTLEEIGIKHSNWWKNLISAVIYFAISVLIPRI